MQGSAFSILLASVLVFATATADASPGNGNVIFITVDGVRYHEIFQGVRKEKKAGETRGTPIVPFATQLVNDSGFFFGNRHAGADSSEMRVSNLVGVSQPGYRALMTGDFEKKCLTNDCRNIDRETIFDRLISEGFSSKEVAAFASWRTIDKVLESNRGRIVKSVGFEDIQGLTDAEAAPFRAIQAQANQDRPTKWKNSRFDKYTFQMGMEYLKTHQPRFMYMMWVEPDENAHNGNYRGYVESLRDFDARLVQLTDQLKAMGTYGENTSIVVTTDHGRGLIGPLWTIHGPMLEAMRTWAMVIPSERLRKSHRITRDTRGKKNFHQVDIRPTLETFLGLQPRPAAGKSLKERGRSLVQLN